MDPVTADRSAPGGPRWARWVGIPVALLALVGLGALLGPGAGRAYLDLQRASDGVHRFAVFGFPGALSALLVGWLWRRLFASRPRLAFVGRALGWGALGFAALLIGFLGRFDAAIEQRGEAGQLVVFSRTDAVAAAAGPQLGPFLEERDGPGVGSTDLPDGDFVTLDRRALSRKSAAGRFRWSRSRPGRAPGALLIAADLVWVLAPSAEHEDDLALHAFALSSGAPRWTFHCLGVSFEGLRLEGGEISFRSVRPSGSVVYRLDQVSGQKLPAR